MKEPVDHILRPRLPWRPADEGPITECGYDATKVKTLTRAEFFQRQKDMGERRTAMLTCMTCSDTARRWRTWEDDPRLAMQREIEWERNCGYYSRGPDLRGSRLKDELIAIKALIEAHKDEFTAMITENEQRREWLEKKAALSKRQPPPKPHSL
jgi:hypothetical protein